MLTELFEALDLPVQAVSPDDLARAYRGARERWFFRQYDPRYAAEARARLARIDEAYKTLRDMGRQSAVVRQAKSEKRIARREAGPPADSASATTSGGAPRIANRPRVVRDAVRRAEQMILQLGRPLNEAEIQQLARAGFEQGLEFADSVEIVERIARDLAGRLAAADWRAREGSATAQGERFGGATSGRGHIASSTRPTTSGTFASTENNTAPTSELRAQ